MRAWQARAVSVLVTWAEAAESAGAAHGARSRAGELADAAADRCLSDACLGYGLLSAAGGPGDVVEVMRGLQDATQRFYSAFADAAAKMAAEWVVPETSGGGATVEARVPAAGVPPAASRPSPSDDILNWGKEDGALAAREELGARLEAAEAGLLEALQRAEDAEAGKDAMDALIGRLEHRARVADQRAERAEEKVREARLEQEDTKERLSVATQQVEKLGFLVQGLNEELNASRRDVRSCPASSIAVDTSPSSAAYPLSVTQSVVRTAPTSRFEPGTSPIGSCSGVESPLGPQENPFFESDADSGGEGPVEGPNPFEEDKGGGSGRNSNPFEADASDDEDAGEIGSLEADSPFY